LAVIRQEFETLIVGICIRQEPVSAQVKKSVPCPSLSVDLLKQAFWQ
jgi:hypothetical protein